MNCASSRSHAVFALELEISAHDGRRFTPKLLFVDLAGSECAERTGASGKRLSESGTINRSLLALGCVLTWLGSVTLSLSLTLTLTPNQVAARPGLRAQRAA